MANAPSIPDILPTPRQDKVVPHPNRKLHTQTLITKADDTHGSALSDTSRGTDVSFIYMRINSIHGLQFQILV